MSLTCDHGNGGVAQATPDIMRPPPVEVPLDTDLSSFAPSALDSMDELLAVKEVGDNIIDLFTNLQSIRTGLAGPKNKPVKFPGPKTGQNTQQTIKNRTARPNPKPAPKPPPGRRLRAEFQGVMTGGWDLAETTRAPQFLFGMARGGRMLKADVTAADTLPDWSYLLPSIQDQDGCTSCWAFVITALAEAAHWLNTGEMVSLSAKKLLDCASPVANCTDGSFCDAFKYINSAGLGLKNDYKAGVYTPAKERCNKPANRAAFSKLQKYIPLPTNEDTMLRYLAKGPIAATVYADKDWHTYRGGVYNSSSCKVTAAKTFNHAVVIVGAGVDESTGTPYWRIRNSWGAQWGEQGYMRLERGTGMCGIHLYAWQVESADTAGSTPLAPGTLCKTQTTSVGPDPTTTSLTALAKRFKTTVSQIIQDNQVALAASKVLRPGQKLLITYPVGKCSEPYANQDDLDKKEIALVPAVAVCPSGSYVVSIYARPSSFPFNRPDGNTYIGTTSMTCSDGTLLLADAQPGYTPFDVEAMESNMNGFTSLSFRSSEAVYTLAGAGVGQSGLPPNQLGVAQTLNCNPNHVITGFAAGAQPGFYPQSYIVNFQIQCNNPFTAVTGELLQASTLIAAKPFQRVSSGVSCQTYTAIAGDTWLKVAIKLKITAVAELIRSNPAVSGQLKAGDVLFLPPCIGGASRVCRQKKLLYVDSQTLADLAKRYKTAVSAIILDNKLSLTNPLTNGKQLKIACPTGQWSVPYATMGWPTANVARVSAIPSVLACPEGAFVKKISAFPGQYPVTLLPASSRWISTVQMTCSDGTLLSVDAQPQAAKQAAPTATTLSPREGFTSLRFSSGFALDSLAGAGNVNGGQLTEFVCGPSKVLTGFAAGADPGGNGGPGAYPNSYIVNFQLLCGNTQASNSTSTPEPLTPKPR